MKKNFDSYLQLLIENSHTIASLEDIYNEWSTYLDKFILLGRKDMTPVTWCITSTQQILYVVPMSERVSLFNEIVKGKEIKFSLHAINLINSELLGRYVGAIDSVPITYDPCICVEYVSIYNKLIMDFESNLTPEFTYDERMYLLSPGTVLTDCSYGNLLVTGSEAGKIPTDDAIGNENEWKKRSLCLN